MEYAADFPRSDDFFDSPAGIEQMDGCLARVINLRGEVTSINAEALRLARRESAFGLLPAFSLTSIPAAGALVELVEPAFLGEQTRQLFASGPARLEGVVNQGSMRLATVSTEQGERTVLGLGHLKRADLREQANRLLQRRNQELCVGAGVGVVGNMAVMGGVRMAMRSAS